MNQYQYRISDDNLATTTIENIFINEYMPKANGDYVKIYLFGLKQATNHQSVTIDNRDLAKNFSLTEGDVIAAWKYWEDQKILKVEYIGSEKIVITYDHILSNMLVGDQPEESPETTVDASDDENERRIQEMFFAIEGMMGRPLTGNEMHFYKSCLQDLHFTPETVVLLVEYSMNMIGKKDESFSATQILNYTKQVAKGWSQAGVHDHTQAEAHMKDTQNQQKNLYEIFKYLGLNRQPMDWEKKMITTWQTDYGYDLSIIVLALERTHTPNIRYVDGILKNWHQKGYRTVEDVQGEVKPSSTKRQPSKPLDAERQEAYDTLALKDEEWLWRSEDE